MKAIAIDKHMVYDYFRKYFFIMKWVVSAAFIIILSSTVSAQLYINEFSATNSSIISDPDYNKYSDWVEIYNDSESDLNLSGYFITDNFNSPDKWQIPVDLIIPTKGITIIWTDGMATGIHANFRLSADGEEIALYSPDLKLLDSISFGPQKTDISFGRITNGNTEWGFFKDATPNSSNTSIPYSGFCNNIPVFQVRGGFFNAPVRVEIFNDLGGIIRYTSDGSAPDINSPIYTSALDISQTSIIRARIFKEDMLPGPTQTQSYFINKNSVDGKLPVISLVSAPENFWDEEKGIYVQDFKPEWDIPINIELFENNGSDRAAFNEAAGTKVNGLYSWKLPQKMLGIYFKKQYGSGNLEYPLLYQRKRLSYKSFALRASGSDWAYTLFRDIVGQHATLLNMNLDVMSYRPAVVYINGEYMGIHNMREKVDDDYIEKSHNMEAGSFDLIENGDYPEAGDLTEYDHLLSLVSKDLSITENYNAVADIVDIENVTDFLITEIAVRNTSIDHNVMVWKPKNKGKWKWVLMDLDRGFFNPREALIDFYAKNNKLFLKNLIRNQNYKEYFAKRLSAQLYTSFHPKRMYSLIDQHMEIIEAEMPEHIKRWEGAKSSYGNAIPSMDYWINVCNNLKTFTEIRPLEILDDLKDYGFEEITNLVLINSTGNDESIKIDNLLIPEYVWAGPYLKNVEIKLEAEDQAGYEFKGWTKDIKYSIIPKESGWKYKDTGEYPGTEWNKPAYNDSDWDSGIGQFGYGDGDENTIISYGDNSSDKYVTTYFRKIFSITSEDKKAPVFVLNLLKDDGAIIYLNGKEILRSNMHLSKINYESFAVGPAASDIESLYFPYLIDSSLFVLGENTLAVEIHQNEKASSDLSFDLELVAYIPDQNYISQNNTLNFDLNEDTYLRADYTQTTKCIIPEIISEDLSLGIDCSPYIVQGDVFIEEDATLNIEPGVEIWMSPGANFYINGEIHAIGTSENNILIKLHPEFKPASWGGLIFRNTSKVSELRYLVIEDASQGPDPVLENAAISAFHANLEMDNLWLENNYGNPILGRYSEISLTNSFLHSEITGDFINVKYGKAKIENCRFVGNNQVDTDAIDYDEITNGIISNCQISDFLGFNSDAIDIGEAAKNIQIDSIFVYNITDKGVSVGQRSSVSIQNSIFVNCNMGVGVKDSSWAYLNQCIFYGNVEALASFEKNSGMAGGNLRVKNSIISNSSKNPVYSDSKSSLEVIYSLTDSSIFDETSTNIFGNPLFQDPGYFDFGLKEESPAIQTGNQNGIIVDIGTNSKNIYKDPPVCIQQLFINSGNLNFPEFITLYNPSDKRKDLTGYSITKGIDITIPPGIYLDPHEILYLSDNAYANSWWKQKKQVLQWESGKLSNTGEAVQLEESHGIVIDYFKFSNNGLWPAKGFSEEGVFQLKNAGLDNHFPESWETTTLSSVIDTDESLDVDFMRIYPNPTKDFINIQSLNDEYQYVEIYNLTGQQIGKTRLNDKGLGSIDLSVYTNGILIIKIGDKTKKVVLMK